MYNDWNTTIIDTQAGIHTTVTWKCTHPEKDIEETVTVTLDKEKTYPEENFKYEGKVNDKQVKGSFITGHGPAKGVQATDENTKLTKPEQIAGIAHINWLT